MWTLKLVCLSLAVTAGFTAYIQNPDDKTGNWGCSNIDHAKETALIDNEALKGGKVKSAKLISSELKFSVTSTRDPDKVAKDACLTGKSWIQNEHTDRTPAITADMGNNKNVCGIVLSGRADYSNDRCKKFYAKVSKDNNSWDSAMDRGNGDSDEFLAMEEEPRVKNEIYYMTKVFAEPLDGRYVQLSIDMEHTRQFIITAAAMAVRMGVLYDCEWMDGCTPNPCQNGATCESKPFGNYQCTCAPGFGGDHCEQQTGSTSGACASNPCKNGGNCENFDNEQHPFTCRCPDGWTGNTCEESYQGTPHYIGCRTQVRDGLFHNTPDFEALAVKCPPHDSCRITDTIWGSPERYTSDSSICKAAIQTFGPNYLFPGRVINVWKVGLWKQYAMSFDNMIISLDYDALQWQGYTLLESEMKKQKAQNPPLGNGETKK